MIRSNPFSNDTSGRLLIEDAVFATLYLYRQFSHTAPESGGIFLGFRRGEHLHIVEATVPSKLDKRSRFGFYRQAASHQKIALKRWHETGETMDYMGEWHSHPEDIPRPSGTDLRNWLEITVPRRDPMVFVIIGRRDDWIGVSRGVEVVLPGFPDAA